MIVFIIFNDAYAWPIFCLFTDRERGSVKKLISVRFDVAERLL